MWSRREDLPTAILEQTAELPAGPIQDIYAGPYRLLQKLVVGGMGEVYLAEDPRLDRKIALKMLREEFTQDPQRVMRFVREAKTTSALDHPNIVTIFDIGEADGRHYMATEYVHGQTLREHMTTREAVASVLDIGIQMAAALEAAHQVGIIHRDIKPENVIVRPDGLVKILDFGIAKLVERDRPSKSCESVQDCSVSRTLALDEYATNADPLLNTATPTIECTAPGLILGTVSYMSPEQVRGQPIDARSDIFSLGVLLYEMIAGKAPFAGDTQADRIAAILDREPAPLDESRRDVPPELDEIVSKALRKDRETRYQSAKELLADLKDLKSELEFKEKLEHSGDLGRSNKMRVMKTHGLKVLRLFKVSSGL